MIKHNNRDTQRRSWALSFLAALFLHGGFSTVDSHANVFQSQTFYRQFDGTIQVLLAQPAPYYNRCDGAGKNCRESLESAAWIFEKENPLPPTARMGGNFAVFQGSQFATVSAEGGLYYKGNTTQFKPEPFSIGIIGGNYFLKEGSGQLVTIDSHGFWNDTFLTIESIRVAGGNYFINNEGLISTVKAMGVAPGNPSGQVYRAQLPEGLTPEEKKNWQFNNVVKAGGNFFVNLDGSVVTISSETGFFAGPMVVPSKPKWVAGTYYVGEDDQVYTIDQQGVIRSQKGVPFKPIVLGYSFFIGDQGQFGIVTGDGSLHHQAAWISTTGVYRRLVNKINPLNIDLGSIYLPTIIR